MLILNNIYIFRPGRRKFKLFEKPSALEREHPGLHINIFLHLFCRCFFAHLNLNPNLADQNQWGSGSTTLLGRVSPWILIFLTKLKSILNLQNLYLLKICFVLCTNKITQDVLLVDGDCQLKAEWKHYLNMYLSDQCRNDCQFEHLFSRHYTGSE